MPGGPEIKIARKVPVMSLPGFLKLLLTDLGLKQNELRQSSSKTLNGSDHASSQLISFSTCPLLPQMSLSDLGAYLTVQSWLRARLHICQIVLMTQTWDLLRICWRGNSLCVLLDLLELLLLLLNVFCIDIAGASVKRDTIKTSAVDTVSL